MINKLFETLLNEDLFKDLLDNDTEVENSETLSEIESPEILSEIENPEILKEKINKLKENSNLLSLVFGKELTDSVINLLETSVDKAIKKQEENKPKFVRPSEKLTTEQGLQLHKIVGEYVDTMIKPYAKDKDIKVINDAYGGLYEFAAWVLLKK